LEVLKGPEMRETARSLQIYLVIFGLIGTLASLGALFGNRAGALGVLVGVASLIAGASLLYAGLRLRYLIRGRLRQLLSILYFNIGLNTTFSLFAAESIPLLGMQILGVILLWYILVNAKRLAREAAST